jgi:DNA-binding NarL/FixJ family response regulator
MRADLGIRETEPPRGQTGRVRVAIIDDHELIRFGIMQLINRTPDWIACGEAADQVSGLQLIREKIPDVAIIDLRLKEGDGLELVKQVHLSCPEVRMLVSSMHDEQLYAERCLRAGARGYINKQEPLETLVEAVQRILDGRVYLSPEMTERLLVRTSGRPEGAGHSPLELLSDRELEVFEALGRGLSVKEIAQAMHLSPKTVEYHREHIKEKLQLPSSSAVLRHATAWTLKHC